MRVGRKGLFFAGGLYLITVLSSLLPRLARTPPPLVPWEAWAGLLSARSWAGEWQTSENSKQLAHNAGAALLFFADPASEDEAGSFIFFTLWLRDSEFTDEHSLRFSGMLVFDSEARSLRFSSEGSGEDHAVIYEATQPERSLNCSLSANLTFPNQRDSIDLNTEALLSPGGGLAAALRGEGADAFSISVTLWPEPPTAALKSLGYGVWLVTVGLLNLLGAASIFARGLEDSAQMNRLSLATLLVVCLQDSFVLMLSLSLGADLPFDASYIVAAMLFFGLFTLVDYRLLLLAWRCQRGAELAALDGEQLRRRACFFQVKFYLAVVCYNYFMWRLFLDPLFVVAQGFVLWPQVFRLSTQPLSPRFDADFSLLLVAAKFLLFAYWRGCPRNFTAFRPQPAAVSVGVAALLLSLLVLLAQSRRGGRFFLPRSWRKEYAYFVPRMRLASETGSDNCPICLDALLSECAPSSEEVSLQSHFASAAARRHARDVMRAPCGHTFHPACLLQWMERKMECPACRAALPQLY